MKKTLFFLALAIGLAATMAAGEIMLTARVVPISGGEEGFFTRAQAMILTGERLFLLENLKHRVLLFRLRGGRAEFLKAIGRRGQGPGDLYLPFAMTAAEGELSVRDEYGVSRFALDGEFLGRFRVPFRSLAMERSAGSYYFLSAIPGEAHLIHALSGKGAMAGSLLRKTLDIQAPENKETSREMLERYFYEGRLFAAPGRLYYLNTMLAGLTELDLSGRQVRSACLEPGLGAEARENASKNREMLWHGLEAKRQPDGGVAIPWRVICRDVCLLKGRLYLLDSPGAGESGRGGRRPGPCIRRVDLNALRTDAVFCIDGAGEAPDIQAFVVGEEGGAPFFLACQEVDGDSGIVRYDVRPTSKPDVATGSRTGDPVFPGDN